MIPDDGQSRRRFFVELGGAGVVGGLALGVGVLARGLLAHRHADAGESSDGDAGAWIEGDYTPIEDLMREHAVLERVLLVYEDGARRLEAGLAFAPEILARAGGLVRRYIEDHHERDEETHVFPRLEQIGAELELVRTLRAQHLAGRRLTSEVIDLATLDSVRDVTRRARLIEVMRLFVRMYRPHAARENTVLFPSLRKAVSQKEYETLRVTLERSEYAAYGSHLYETVLAEVEDLERSLGIEDLATFTPP
jgi:hemerythrin-like domain-containing protein